MSLSHGETVKSLSLAFKPGKGLEDEGQRIWLGTSAGDLHEVDIPSQSIVATRSYPSRREVIQILRHKKEMWTFDDEGRLLVWMPDETGQPNLQYSYHSAHERVARGHTFSMAVGDKLWLAAGKDVHIYRPNAREDASFKVFKRPLGLQHSGDVTSGTYTTREGGRVYLGHADGKVTVYSSTDYTCLAVVNVSVYKINCLGFVGDYLWAAYKTGMIYVYDVSTNPWTVKKDWRAHDSPVSGFVLDTSSVWTMNRLQVTSLGTDNCIRLWDGMLEDDWLGKFTFCWLFGFTNIHRYTDAAAGRRVLQFPRNQGYRLDLERGRCYPREREDVGFHPECRHAGRSAGNSHLWFPRIG
jgi:WD40 repeat protein